MGGCRRRLPERGKTPLRQHPPARPRRPAEHQLPRRRRTETSKRDRCRSPSPPPDSDTGSLRARTERKPIGPTCRYRRKVTAHRPPPRTERNRSDRLDTPFLRDKESRVHREIQGNRGQAKQPSPKCCRCSRQHSRCRHRQHCSRWRDWSRPPPRCLRCSSPPPRRRSLGRTRHRTP
jgi:hypothetical protein